MLLLACCGGSATPPAPISGPPAAMVAVPAAGDVQVATVDGRPVWGSCVAAQLQRFPSLTRRAALDQCIDFELLARAAEGRDLATDREVVDATRTALVRRLVDAFEAKYPDPDSLRAQIDEVLGDPRTATTRPEMRASFHVLYHLDDRATEATRTAARQAAEQLYQQLGAETGLFPDQLRAAADKIAVPANVTLEIGDYYAVPKDNTQTAPEYVGALFAIPEVGRVSPVVKTQYGYHVILLTEIQPEAALERTQVFAGLRRNLFVQYVNELTKQTRTEVHPELLEPADREATP